MISVVNSVEQALIQLSRSKVGTVNLTVFLFVSITLAYLHTSSPSGQKQKQKQNLKHVSAVPHTRSKKHL